MATRKRLQKLFALLLVLSMTMGMLNITAFAAGGDEGDHSHNAIICETCGGDHEVEVTVPCSACGGTGNVDGSAEETCGSCNGTGKRQEAQECVGCIDGYTSCTGEFVGEVTTAATCVAAGVMTYTCETCQASYTEEIPVDAAAHQWGEPVALEGKLPTCVDDGEGTRTCVLCEAQENVVMPATGQHTYDDDLKCTVCGAAKPGEEPEEMTQESLQKAIDEVEPGGTVTLTGNVALASTVTISKSLVLDLNGFILKGDSVEQLLIITSRDDSSVDVTIQDGTLDGGKSAGLGDQNTYGGAIYCTAGKSNTLKLINCVFMNNVAGIGSALWTNSSLYMKDCIVKNNVGVPGTNYGSAVAVKGPTTSEGADAPKIPFVTITGCTFEANGRDNPSTLGGAVYLLGVDTAMVSGSSFTANQGGTGGAVYCSNSNSFSVTDSEFNGNTSVSGSGGGAAYVDNTKKLNFDGCTFTNNTANAMGGAICSGAQNSLTVTGCTFTGNTVTNGNGGAISHQSGPAEISDSEFTNNTADIMGGAILVADTFSKDTTLKLERCTIKDSTGGYGGALAIQGIKGSYTVPATVDSETTITNSIATVYGGAIYAAYMDLDLGADISGATSPSYGGAVYAYLGDLNVTGNITGAVGANYGGAIYANQANVTVTSTITGNSVTLHSTGGYGGGIASLYGTLTLGEGAAVYNNTAAGAGDDIYSMGMEGYPNVLNLVPAGEMSGDLLLADGEKITGWYLDGLKGADTTKRWSVDSYYTQYTPVKDETVNLALKAAHGAISSGGGGSSYDYYTVTVNYLDKDSGEKIAQSYVSGSIREGRSYDVTAYDAIAIEGYAYDSTTGDPLTGTMNGNKVINVWYVAEDTDITDPEVPGGELPENPDGEDGTEPGTDPGVDIEDPDVPGAEVPETGDVSALWLALSALSGTGLAGVTLLGRKKRDEE